MMDRKLKLSIILEALDRATAPMRGLQGQTDRTAKSLRAGRADLKKLEAAQKDIGAYRGLQQQLRQNRDALQQAQTRAQALAREHAAAENPTRKLGRAMEAARREVRRLETQQESHVRALRDVRGRLDDAGVSTRNLGRDEAHLRQSIDRTTARIREQSDQLAELGRRQGQVAAARRQYDQTRQFASNLQSTGQSSVAAGVATAAPVILAGREAVSLEAQMAEIRKVVDFDTPEQFQQMRRDIIDLSTEVPMAAEGIAAIIAAAGQANIPRAELLGFARDAATMGVAFDTTADLSGETMATWRTAFGMNQDQVRTLADQINYLGNNSAAAVDKVTDVVTRVGPLGAVGGVAAAEIAALGATMVAAGVETDRAGTGIQNLILGLTRGEAATLRQRQGFQALGLDAEVMARRMQEDATGAITDVMTRLSELDEHRQAAVLSNLFGRESIGAIAPLLTQLDVLQTHLGMVGDEALYGGSMMAEFINVDDTAGSAITKTINALRGMANEYGQQLLPIIKAVGNAIIEKTTALRRFAEANPGLVKVLGALVMAISAALIVFGALAMIVAAVLGPFALMRLSLTLAAPMFTPLIAGVVGATKAFAAWGASMLLNPVTWIVLGIVAAVALLAGLVYVVIRNWEPISTWFAGLWEGLKSGATAAITFMVNAFMRFTPLGHLITAFGAVWRWFPEIKARFLSFGRDLVAGMIDGIFGGLPRLLGAIRNIGGNIIRGFKERLGIRSPSRVFAALGGDTVAGLNQGLDRAAPSAVRAVSRIGAGMAGALAVGVGAAPAIAFTPGITARPAVAAPSGGVAGPGAHYTFNIYAQPGQSAREIAQEVRRILEGDQAAGDLSRFEDDDYGE